MADIRTEKSEDALAIHQVNEAAFGQPAEADLVAAIRRAGKVILSLVAVEDDHVVGHILFTAVTIEPPAEPFKAVGLGPMAVLPEFQRKGIGSLLIQTGRDICRNQGYGCIVVLGHPDYYPRFGFVPASRFGLRCEYDAPDEAFMDLELAPGALRGHSGTVKYLPEFDGV